MKMKTIPKIYIVLSFSLFITNKLKFNKIAPETTTFVHKLQTSNCQLNIKHCICQEDSLHYNTFFLHSVFVIIKIVDKCIHVTT